MRAANLRRWLGRKDCPEVIRQFKRIFDLVFTPRTVCEQNDTVPGNNRKKAHFFYNGVNFSRASTHLGNSLVIYYPPGTSSPVAGSIEKIEVINTKVTFIIRRQKPLAANQFDPFMAFPHFPATTLLNYQQTLARNRLYLLKGASQSHPMIFAMAGAARARLLKLDPPISLPNQPQPYNAL
ncbi:hypothetical protein B0H14DRAFT_3461716 [Mycena olivaceomarginata]|nr:hypothetical protein B0H14DRAFT_3461716 [Mycena olivaceomarginata]